MNNAELDILNFLYSIEDEVNQLTSSKIYLYESHLGGGLYYTTLALTDESRYCEACGDIDMEVERGNFEDLLDKYNRLNHLKMTSIRDLGYSIYDCLDMNKLINKLIPENTEGQDMSYGVYLNKIQCKNTITPDTFYDYITECEISSKYRKQELEDFLETIFLC